MKTISDGPGRMTFTIEPGDRVALLDLEGHRITDVKVMGDDGQVRFEFDRVLAGYTYAVLDGDGRVMCQSGDQGRIFTAGTILNLTDHPAPEGVEPRRCYDTRAELRTLAAVLAVVLVLVAIGVVIGAVLF